MSHPPDSYPPNFPLQPVLFRFLCELNTLQLAFGISIPQGSALVSCYLVLSSLISHYQPKAFITTHKLPMFTFMPLALTSSVSS